MLPSNNFENRLKAVYPEVISYQEGNLDPYAAKIISCRNCSKLLDVIKELNLKVEVKDPDIICLTDQHTCLTFTNQIALQHFQTKVIKTLHEIRLTHLRAGDWIALGELPF